MADTVITQAFEQPAVNKKEILRYAGIKNADSETDSLINECMCEMLPRLTYRTCRQEFNVAHGGEITDLGFVKVNSRSAAKYLENCGRVVVFAATVGIEADRLIARYSAVSPSRALILQAIGAERIESLCNTLCETIKNEKSSQGLHLKTRFSPGYGDFSLSVQKDIFAILDCPRKIGLSLNESMSMSPSKSVTALAGISKSGE